jgi:transposase
MRKGINGLSLLAQSVLSNQFASGAMFVFRGKSASRIKILWWDSQGFEVTPIVRTEMCFV